MNDAIFAQNEKFDIAGFPSPKNWKKETKEGMISFSDVNAQTGAFGIISLYASTTGSGHPMTDFNTNWDKLVAGPFNTAKTPANLSEESINGWNTVTGVIQTEKDGVGFYVFLTVFSGYGKCLSIISQSNDQTYITFIDKLLRSIELDKTTPVHISPDKNYSDQTLKTNRPDGGGSETFGNIIYKVPDGWMIRKSDSRFIEVFPGKLQPEENFSILLLQGKVSNASLEQELADCWDEFARMMGAGQLREVSGNNYNSGEISKTMAGWEYIAGHGSIRTGADFFVHVYIIRVKDRVERVVVLSKEIRLDALRSNIDPSIHHSPYYQTITNFIFNLRFANYNSPELKIPSWKGEGVTGVWAGIGFMGGELKATYVIFFTNGQVYYGSRFPLSGLYNLDSYADKERNPRYWGTYSSEDGKGTVKMLYGSFPFRLEGNKLKMSPISEEHSFIRIPSVDNLKLNGTWMITGENDQPFTITFRPDGTFSDNGALKVLDHSLYQYYSIAGGGGTGKYLIKDHSIIFYYSDGRILIIAFPGRNINPGENSPGELVLSFNEDILIKQ